MRLPAAITLRFPPPDALLWFGVLGGAGAWATQFLANLGLTFAQCDQPTQRWTLPLHGLEIGLSVVAVVVGLSSGGVSLWLYLRTHRLDHVAEHARHGDGVAPPIGRVHFLSVTGLTVNVLALVIIVMTGIGAPLLPVCQQS